MWVQGYRASLANCRNLRSYCNIRKLIYRNSLMAPATTVYSISLILYNYRIVESSYYMVIFRSIASYAGMERSVCISSVTFILREYRPRSRRRAIVSNTKINCTALAYSICTTELDFGDTGNCYNVWLRHRMTVLAGKSANGTCNYNPIVMVGICRFGF